MDARPVRQGIGEIASDEAFPERPVEFVHELHLEKRLPLSAVAELADRLPRGSVIYDTARPADVGSVRRATARCSRATG